MTNTVVVTRHAALITYLIEIGLISADTKVITHATPEDVRGKDVIGVLPLSLACHARTVTEIPMQIPFDLRGKELDINQVRQFAGNPVKYYIFKADDDIKISYATPYFGLIEAKAACL